MGNFSLRLRSYKGPDIVGGELAPPNGVYGHRRNAKSSQGRDGMTREGA